MVDGTTGCAVQSYARGNDLSLSKADDVRQSELTREKGLRQERIGAGKG
jgi:hypothetical protein